MIICNLVGGLGNQMFQYACARSLSLALHKSMKVTLDMFGVYVVQHNGSELDRVFLLDLDVASKSELRDMIGMLRSHPLARKMLATKPLRSLRGDRFIVEPHYRYWRGLSETACKGAYLQGYWQSWRYFAAHAASLRNDFTFRQALCGRNADLAELICSTNSVSVHVRRGDYLSNQKTLSVHGTCSLEFYISAIESIKARHPDLRLFAFSDDSQWVLNELCPRYPDLIVVDHNHGQDSCFDMWLMSLCKHNVIANSSFSWWAAWLNTNPSKIVIAPLRWFANRTDATDLIPANWERI